MELFDKLISNIASIYGVSKDEIEIGESGILIGSRELLFSDFFDAEIENGETLLIKTKNYFNQFSISPENSKKIINNEEPSIEFTIYDLTLINARFDSGIHELTDERKNRVGIVFTGNFSGSETKPDLSMFPEILLAVSIFNGNSFVFVEQTDGWSFILQSLGALAILNKNVSLCNLAECGIFVSNDNSFTFSWNDVLPVTVYQLKNDIPCEAECAYLTALGSSNSPDIAFLHLYRVLEILFAVGLKKKVKESDLYNVINLFNDFGKVTEMQMLATILETSDELLVNFDKSDFFALFSSRVLDGDYGKLNSWISNPRENSPSKQLRPDVIYFIRCSLIHSKLGYKNPYLLGPYNELEKKALSHIVEDMRLIIKSILFD